MTILCMTIIIVLQVVLITKVCKTKIVARDLTTYVLERMLVILLCLNVVLCWIT